MNLLDLTAAELGIATDDPRFKALMTVYQAALGCGVYCVSDADPPAVRAVAKLLPDTVMVIETRADAPDVPQNPPAHRRDQRTHSPVAHEFAPPPPPEPEPVPVFAPPPMFQSPPEPDKSRDLPSLAVSAGLFAEQDGGGNTGIWLLMQGRTILFCGPEQRARQWLADRQNRPRHRQRALGEL